MLQGRRAFLLFTQVLVSPSGEIKETITTISWIKAFQDLGINMSGGMASDIAVAALKQKHYGRYLKRCVMKEESTIEWKILLLPIGSPISKENSFRYFKDIREIYSSIFFLSEFMAL